MEAESSDDDQPLSIPTQPSQLPTRSGLEVYIARVEPAETKWIPLFFEGAANSNVKHIVSDGEGGYGCEVSERVPFKMTETISDLSSFDGVYAKRLRKRYQAENASYNTFTKKRALYAASNCTTKDTHFYWETGNGYASSLLNHIVGYVKFCKTGTDRLEDKATRKTTKRVPMEPPYAKRSKPLLKAVASTALLLPDTNPYWPTSREDRLGSICGHGDPGGPGPGAAGRNDRGRRRSVHQSTCLDESCRASSELGRASQRLKKVSSAHTTSPPMFGAHQLRTPEFPVWAMRAVGERRRAFTAAACRSCPQSAL